MSAVPRSGEAREARIPDARDPCIRKHYDRGAGHDPERHALEPLRDITLVAAGIALAVFVVEVGLWIGARRAQRAVIKAQHEEAGRATEHRSEP